MQHFEAKKQVSPLETMFFAVSMDVTSTREAPRWRDTNNGHKESSYGNCIQDRGSRKKAHP